MHKIDLNQFLLLPDKTLPFSPPSYPLPNPHGGGFHPPKPKTPIKTPPKEVPPLQRDEILKRISEKGSFESRMEGIEREVHRIRGQRRDLKDPLYIKDNTFIKDDSSYRKEDYNKKEDYSIKEPYFSIREGFSEGDWSERLFKDNPSLKELDGLVENQRKNLKEIEDIYNRKKARNMPNKGIFQSNQTENKDLFFDKDLLLQNDSSLPLFKKQHKDLSNQFRESLPQPIIKPPLERSFLNPQKSIKNPYDEKLSLFQKEKQREKDLEVYYKSLEKPDFDNWRKKTPSPSKTPPKSLYKPSNYSSKDLINPFESNKEGVSLKEPKKPPLKDPLLAFLFTQIDPLQTGLVSKQEAFTLLISNEKALLAYNLDKITLYDLLSSFKTSRPGLLTQKEFINFINTPKPLTKPLFQPPKPIEKTPKIHKEAFCSIKPELLSIIKENFLLLDPHNDLIVPRQAFLTQLLKNPKITPFLNTLIASFPLPQKSFTLKEVLSSIINEGLTPEKVLNRSSEFISWGEFFGLLEDPSWVIRQEKEVPKANNSILKEDLLVLRDLFDGIKRAYGDFVETSEFVIEAMKDPLVKGVLGNHAGAGEKIGEFLDRLLIESGEYIDWREVLLALNKEKIEKEVNEENIKVYEGENEENNLYNEENHLYNETKDLYNDNNQDKSLYNDNEELYNGEASPYNIENPLYKDPFPQYPPPNPNKPYHYQLQALDRLHPNELPSINRNSLSLTKNPIKNITVPKGPSFLEKPKSLGIRETKLAEMVSEKQKEENEAINFRFRAKEVPDKVKLPLFNGLLNKEKLPKGPITKPEPFQFIAKYQEKEESRKALSKQEILHKEPTFKAREIPQECKNPLYEELTQKAQEDKAKRVQQRIEENKELVKGFNRMEEADKKKKESLQRKKEDNKEKLDFKPDLKESKQSIEKLRNKGVITTKTDFIKAPDYLDEGITVKTREKKPFIKKQQSSIIKPNEDFDKDKEDFKEKESLKEASSISEKPKEDIKEVPLVEKARKEDKGVNKKTKKQLDMEKLKAKTDLEKKQKEEALIKEELERKAKEEAMKVKVKEKFKVNETKKKPVIKAAVVNVEEERRKLDEKMEKKPLMIDSISFASKSLGRYRKLMDKYKGETGLCEEEKGVKEGFIKEKEEKASLSKDRDHLEEKGKGGKIEEGSDLEEKEEDLNKKERDNKEEEEEENSILEENQVSLKQENNPSEHEQEELILSMKTIVKQEEDTPLNQIEEEEEVSLKVNVKSSFEQLKEEEETEEKEEKEEKEEEEASLEGQNPKEEQNEKSSSKQEEKEASLEEQEQEQKEEAPFEEQEQNEETPLKLDEKSSFEREKEEKEASCEEQNQKEDELSSKDQISNKNKKTPSSISIDPKISPNDEISEDLNYSQENFESPPQSPTKPTPLTNIPPTSSLHKALSTCITNKTLYKDPDFPATITSLCKDPNNKSYASTYQKVQWLRPSEIFKGQTPLLFDKIDPNDIAQGALGDCYFLATCSAMAEFPDRVQRAFINPCYNAQGAYSIRLYIQGQEQEVLIDDQIPCLNGQPVFTKPIGIELWVLLLEKAWAKTFGSYSEVEGGLPHFAMEHLLGFRSKGFSAESNDEKEKGLFFDAGKLSELVIDADNKGYMICAGTKGQGEVKNKGIVSGHAYSIISAFEIKGEGVFKMRNPWGSFEWQGKYKEDSPIWTKELINQLGMVKADDGVFFMTSNEFIGEFDYLGICYYENPSLLTRKCFNCNKKTAYFFQLDVLKEGSFQILLQQKPKQFLCDNKDYEYSPLDLEIFLYNEKNGLNSCLAYGDSQRFFGACTSCINDQDSILLPKGKCLIRAKVYFKGSITAYNLTIQGLKDSFTCSEANRNDSKSLLSSFLKDQAKKSNEKCVFEPKKAWFSTYGFPEDINRVCIIAAGNEDPKEKMDLVVTLKDPQNLRQGKQSIKGDKAFNFMLDGVQEEVFFCKTIEKNQGFGYGLSAQPKFSKK